MISQVNNVNINNAYFAGKWNFFGLLSKRNCALSTLPQQADTFTRTIPDFKDITKGKFIHQGREAEVYKTNNENYVLRIIKNHIYNPEELKPVNDGNGLIVAANKNNTIQLLRYMKGEPLYGRNWNIVYSELNLSEYLETFNKIKNLPDEAFSEYMQTLENIRKHGYDIDAFNPNNILLDGKKIHIVDIAKKKDTLKGVHITDFYALVDYFHVKNFMSAMSNEEKIKFCNDVEMLYDRIIAIAQKEGYTLQRALPIPNYQGKEL